MTWWLVGTGSDLALSFDTEGSGRVSGVPLAKHSEHYLVSDRADPKLVARLRAAEVSWSISAKPTSISVTLDKAYDRLAVERWKQCPDLSLAAAVFIEGNGKPDQLAFSIFVPPLQFELLAQRFADIVGRPEVAYRVGAALTPDQRPVALDRPLPEQLVAGHPHFTAGVEFGIFAAARLK